MIFLLVLFGALLLLLRTANKIFSFFRRGGGKEEDQEERMFLLGAAVRRTKGVGGFTVARAEGVRTISSSKKKEKKVQETLDSCDDSFFLCGETFLSFFLSSKSVCVLF